MVSDHRDWPDCFQVRVPAPSPHPHRHVLIHLLVVQWPEHVSKLSADFLLLNQAVADRFPALCYLVVQVGRFRILRRWWTGHTLRSQRCCMCHMYAACSSVLKRGCSLTHARFADSMLFLFCLVRLHSHATLPHVEPPCSKTLQIKPLQIGGPIVNYLGLKYSLVLGSIGFPLYGAGLYCNSAFGE